MPSYSIFDFKTLCLTKNLYHMNKILIFGLLALMSMNLLMADEARLLRFPDIHHNKIAFSHAGDIYLVSDEGGMARRVTSHIGYEMFPRFSPDGKKIAFTGQYDGNTEVFTVPSTGGSPRRITYTATLSRDDISDRMGPNNITMEWTNDGKHVIYRSRKQSYNSFKGRLFKAPVQGGVSKELPLSEGGFCSFSPDGKKLAFNRVFREFRTWKRYRGGMADDIWVHITGTDSVYNITDHPAQDIFPMWIKENIYFISDRTGTMNLYSYSTGTGDIEQLTDYTNYDIKFPSAGNDAIVYENGGYIYKFDIQSNNTERIHINIANDFVYGRNEIIDASKQIFSAGLSPEGTRIIFSAHGELFSVPSEEGITYNLSQTSGVHERDGIWSPDGKYIACISDRTGEFEIYIREPETHEEPIQLTSGADTYKYGMEWSPDSKKLLWSDRKLRLKYIDIESKKVTLVDQAIHDEIRNYNWSPDSKWITYTKEKDNSFDVVYIYNLKEEKSYAVTEGWYDTRSANFSADGKYLLFASARDFNPVYSNTEWNHAYKDMSKVYLAILSKDTPSPFAPKNNKVPVKENSKKEKDGDSNKNKSGEDHDEEIEISTVGLKDRIISLPVSPSNYGHLYCVNDVVYYLEAGGNGTTLNMYDLEKEEETELGKGMRFTLSPDNQKMLIKSGNQFAVIDLPKAPVSLGEKVDLSDMKMHVDYQAEWKQIFDESWRQMRDFFYVPNMHGYDWKAIHEKYAQLVPYVRHRDDLTYIIGEMIGELNIGHAYVNAGKKPEADKTLTGLLGAKIVKDESGYFRIDKILKGNNWNDEQRSPLNEIGVNVSAGDYIISVNGNDVSQKDNIYEMLVGYGNETVEIEFSEEPKSGNTKTFLIEPIGSESELYYYNWVQSNIDKVNEGTSGQVGYIHIPDMISNGLNEFSKHFYPQLNKKGLIIDARGNGGGNVSPMIIERLRRELTRARAVRNVSEPGAIPRQMMRGPMVLVVDKYTASDGDLFAFAFRKHDIGPVIGERTWGGVVGIRGSLPFVDGSQLRKPEFASYSAEESTWIIEGKGVEPDIHVSNNPVEEYYGKDSQLQRAIKEIKKRLDEYKELPDIPMPPDKRMKE